MIERSKNIIQNSAITLGITLGSMLTTAIGYLFLGCFIGRILHNSTHKHTYYSCACDESAYMTQTEVTILGVVFIIGLMAGLRFLLRKLKFSKGEQIIALIIPLFSNLYVASIIREILSTQVSG